MFKDFFTFFAFVFFAALFPFNHSSAATLQNLNPGLDRGAQYWSIGNGAAFWPPTHVDLLYPLAFIHQPVKIVAGAQYQVRVSLVASSIAFKTGDCPSARFSYGVWRDEVHNKSRTIPFQTQKKLPADALGYLCRSEPVELQFVFVAGQGLNPPKSKDSGPVLFAHKSPDNSGMSRPELVRFTVDSLALYLVK